MPARRRSHRRRIPRPRRSWHPDTEGRAGGCPPAGPRGGRPRSPGSASSTSTSDRPARSLARANRRTVTFIVASVDVGIGQGIRRASSPALEVFGGVEVIDGARGGDGDFEDHRSRWRINQPLTPASSGRSRIPDRDASRARRWDDRDGRRGSGSRCDRALSRATPRSRATRSAVRPGTSPGVSRTLVGPGLGSRAPRAPARPSRASRPAESRG